MSLSFADWKDRLKARWQAWAANPRAALNALGANSLYFALAGTALYPIAEAVARGDLAALGHLYMLGAGVGVNLIANAVQQWADESDAAKQLAADASEHPELVAALDIILEKLEAPQQIENGLTDADRAWFTQMLKAEASRLGSQIVVGPVSNTGSGAIAIGGATAAGAGGVAVKGEVHGSITISRDQVTVQPGGIHAPGAKIILTGDKTKDTAAFERRYLEWVFKKCSPLQLRGIDPRAISAGQGEALALWAVYVALDTTLTQVVSPLASYMSAHEINKVIRGLTQDYIDVHESRVYVVSALEAIDAAPRVVLTGIPGSGKSTFLNYMALCLAGARLGDADWLNAIQSAWAHGAMLPALVTLRDFAARGIPADAAKGRAQMLWEYLALDLHEAGLGGLTDHIQSLAGNEGVVFMLDGLDEVPEGHKRDRVREAVDEFAMTCGDQSHIIVTARPYAYDDPDRRLAGFTDPFRLAPFNNEQIEQFITAWYSAVEKAGWIPAREAKQKALSLRNAAWRTDLRPIAERPLLLTLMATLHSSRGKLPDDRADLYNDVVELLLLHWNESKGDEKGLLDALDVPTLKMPDIRRKIEQVAFEAHEAQDSADGPADIDGDDIIRTFRPLLGNSRDKAALVIEYIEKRAGLLNGLGEKDGRDRYAFPHRSFQEYLAGCYLAGLDDFRAKAVEKVRAASAQWREVFVLGARHARADRGIPAADALIHSLSVREFIDKYGMPDENQWRSAIVAGLSLLEIGQAAITADPASVAVRDRVTGWLLALIETPHLLSLQDRIEAGNTLGRFGDPRFPVQIAADGTPYILPPAVRVEAGPFEMGSDERESDASGDEYYAATKHKRHIANVPEFWIGQYPVTNVEYCCFVQTTSREAPSHWLDSDVPPGLENHPVVHVSWRDAMAYCEWLSKASGWMVRLPTETEWEKAARWDKEAKHSRIYPWGDERDTSRCNTWERGPHDTTTVGIYPDGVSPSGLLDAAGNVQEWTLDLFKTHPYDSSDSGQNRSLSELRVLRGGSWNLNQSFARCAFRNYFHSDDRYDFIGFRVVVSSGSREG